MASWEIYSCALVALFGGQIAKFELSYWMTGRPRDRHLLIASLKLLDGGPGLGGGFYCYGLGLDAGYPVERLICDLIRHCGLPLLGQHTPERFRQHSMKKGGPVEGHQSYEARLVRHGSRQLAVTQSWRNSYATRRPYTFRTKSPACRICLPRVTELVAR